jgi:hypothetical protein
MSDPLPLLPSVDASQGVLLQLVASFIKSNSAQRIRTFLKNKTSNNHTALKNLVAAWKDSNLTANSVGGTDKDALAGFRVVVLASDGNVVLDTYKSDLVNVLSNFLNGTIGANHHTRPEALRALLGNDGRAFSVRESSTTNERRLYFAHRLGDIVRPDGMVIFSMVMPVE